MIYFYGRNHEQLNGERPHGVPWPVEFVAVIVVLLICLLFLGVFGATQCQGAENHPEEYVQNYRAAKKAGRCLAVMLTMRQCVGCVDVEQDKKYGETTLRRLPYYMKLQVEDHPKLAEQLAGANVACPQLCCFWYRDGKWIVERYVGAHEIKRVVKVRILCEEPEKQPEAVEVVSHPRPEPKARAQPGPPQRTRSGCASSCRR